MDQFLLSLPCPLILALLLFLPFNFTLGVGGGYVSLGSQILADGGHPWLSDNKIFAFGFASISAGTRDQFLVAVWYYNLPDDPTIVWSPNRDFPASRNAVVKLDQSGELILLDGDTTLWQSNTSRLNADSALLSDSGNLILYAGGNGSRREVWQSFSHPSDTLLPGQPLSVDLELTSAASPLGYYSLKMLQQRTSLSLALTFVTSAVSSPAHTNYSYWSSPEISNATGEVVAILDDSGSFGISYGASSAGTMYVHKNDTAAAAAAATVLRRITIGADGNLRLFRWEINSSAKNWATEWSAVPNPCTVAGICGSGICNLNSSDNSASCTCLPPAEDDDGYNASCLSREQPPLTPSNCSAFLHMEAIQQTNYYFSGASTISNYSGLAKGAECAERCRADCECVAAVYGLSEEKPYCWTLKSMVFGGLQDPSSTLYVKVGASSRREAGNSSSSPSSSTGVRVVLPLLLCFGVLLALLSLMLCYSVKKKKKMERRRQREAIGNSLSLSGNPSHFSYHELQSATSNFSQLLGTGGFGSVYKGTLKDGTLVAVKKLDKLLPQGEREFITEVTTIGSMHHMNLVSLCGFCSEQSHRLLVYEFMSNGSLDKWIFPPDEGRLLQWRTRLDVAIAIAQGIAYFHEQCRNRIIHCDIKPENILLDEDFCPKVSDFGLAKLMSRQHSHVVTMVRGTRGYLAPEWVSNRPITVKADVYSYGMLLLEIIGGRRNLDASFDEKEFFFPSWAFKEMTKGTPANAVDKRLKGAAEEEEVRRALHVAFWCIQEEATMRPSMGEVVRMLEGGVAINAPPMPQTVMEFEEEGPRNVYRAMRGDYYFSDTPLMPSSAIASSRATCSHSTVSPR